MPLTLRLRPLPETSKGVLQVKSLMADRVYEVNLAEQTCTCPDFVEGKRASHPLATLPRMCKHLLGQLDKAGVIEYADDFQEAVVRSGYGGPIGIWRIERKVSATGAWVTLSREGDWLNVLARKKRRGETFDKASGGVGVFGWNVREQRWARGEAPPGARELRQILGQLEGRRDRPNNFT